MHLFLSCEHASKRIPPKLAFLFAEHAAVLNSHRGIDFGALALARLLAQRCRAPLQQARVSRLVVDLNRSQAHPRCLSEMTHRLGDAEKKALLDRYYWPYRRALAAHMAHYATRGVPVVHIGVHSFTPVWRGEVRRVDVGLLFDPARPAEARLCKAWQAELQRRRPAWRVRRNNPYRGTADGLTTSLRRRLPPSLYAGIEVEMNQALSLGPAAAQRADQKDIVDAFCTVWRSFKQTDLNAV